MPSQPFRGKPIRRPAGLPKKKRTSRTRVFRVRRAAGHDTPSKIDLSRLTQKQLPVGREIIATEFDKNHNAKLSYYVRGKATHNVEMFYIPSATKKSLVINKFSQPDQNESQWLLARLLVFAKKHGFKQVMGIAYPKTPEAEMYQKFHFTSVRESEGAQGVDTHYVYTLSLDHCIV